MPAELFLPLIVFLPLLGAVLNMVFFSRHSSRALIILQACGFVFLAFLATLGAFKGLAALPKGEALQITLANWGPVAGDKFIKVGFLGDQISIWFALVVTGVGFLIHLFSAWYMADDIDFRRYFAKLNYFIFAMSLLVMADGYAGLAMGWANVGFASYSLIGFWRTKEAPPTAAIKAFLVNLIGELGLFVAIATLWLKFGTLSYSEVFPKVGEMAKVDPGVVTFIGLFLLWGACAKSAQLPLHVWLPDAMQGPTSVSALIHAATMVTAGVYLTARSYPIYQASETASMALATVGALSALFGALCATCAYDIKRVLAFSTMSQIGYMMLGVGAGAFIPALFHFQTHAFFKALLFLTSGAIIHALAGEQDIRRMGGLGKKDKFIWLMFLVGTLALGGMPGFSGFFSKDEILGEVLANGHPVLWGLGVLTAGITAFYCVRLFTLTFGGQIGPAVAAAYDGAGAHGHDDHGHHDDEEEEEDEDYEDEAAHDDHGHGQGHHGGGLLMWFPLVVLAILSVAAGVEGIPGVTHIAADYLSPYFTKYTEAHGGAHSVNYAAIGVVVAVSAIAAFISYGLYRPGGSRRQAALDMTRPASGLLYSAFYVDEIYEAILIRPTKWIAGVVGQGIDPNFVDGAVNGVASVVDWVGGGVRAAHDGLVRRYAFSIVLGVVAIVAYFAWI